MKTGFHKTANIRLRSLFSPDLAFCEQLWLFYAQRWIFFRKQGTSLKDSLECILQLKFDFCLFF